MKKILLLLNILLIQEIVPAQNPLIQQMVNQVRSDSMWNYITTLSSPQRFTYATTDPDGRRADRRNCHTNRNGAGIR